MFSPSAASSSGLELPPAILKAGLRSACEKVMLCFLFLNLCINFERRRFDFLKANKRCCIQRLVLTDSWAIHGLLLKDFLDQKVDGNRP